MLYFVSNNYNKYSSHDGVNVLSINIIVCRIIMYIIYSIYIFTDKFKLWRLITPVNIYITAKDIQPK